jgi:heptosyltransferase I
LKILILKPSSLGDVVQALPVLRLLKRHRPDAEVYWWVGSALAPLLEGDPDLAGVIRFERRHWAQPRSLLQLCRDIRWMRAQAFDWVIDLQGLARSAAIGWLARGGLYVGLDTPREGARGFYDLSIRRASFLTHAVDWYLSVLPRLGVPTDGTYQWLPERPEVAARVRGQWPVANARWLILQPGARWSNKRWPAESYAALVRALAAAEPELHFAILGGTEDRPLGDTIAQAAPERSLNLAGKTSLPEMVEWIRQAELMVTNDTGPMHVAAALGKPVIAIFGPTEPRRTGPYGQLQNVIRVDLPCAPCLKSRCHYHKPMECLRAIAPEIVFTRAMNLLSADGTTP